MNMAGYLLIDGNSVAHAANAAMKLRSGEKETQAIYGMLKTLRVAIARYPILAPIVLWDGATWRKDYFAEYKAPRNVEGTEDKPLTKTELLQQDLRASLVKQKPDLMKGIALLGVTQIRAQNLEADDLAGLLVRRYTAMGKKIMMLTGDKDWIQLVGPGVGWCDHRDDERVTMANLEKKTGVKSPSQWLEVKALMGDTSDNIGGVGGIGEKGAVELINTYGTVASFINQAHEPSEGDKFVKGLPKKFRDFAESVEKQAIFTRNMRLMDLNSPHIPPAQDFRVIKGILNKPLFEQFCRELTFGSIVYDLSVWIKPFEQRIAA